MAYNTILLDDQTKDQSFHGEAIANAAITPGHLIEYMSTGKVRVHATAGGDALRMFALEDELQGKEISAAYTAATQCQFAIVPHGGKVYARVKSGESIAIGDKLQSAGDGTLSEFTASSAGVVEHPECIVGVALAASTGGLCAIRAM